MRYFFTFLYVMQRNKPQIFGKTSRIILAKVCFLVFAIKMFVSATPVFVDTLDSSTILQIVLQLEIENTGKNTSTNSEDLHEHGIKIWKPDSTDFLPLALLTENELRRRAYLRDDKHRCLFDERVPTPPPNC